MTSAEFSIVGIDAPAEKLTVNAGDLSLPNIFHALMAEKANPSLLVANGEEG
jgi:hypothetical protein